MRGFAWHAAQSSEKYTKAACLMNGIEAKFGHNFTIGLQALVAAMPEAFPIEIERPHNYTYKEQVGEFQEELLKFATRLERLGTPNGRYQETNLSVSPYDLVKLDIFVKILRRVTIDLEEFHGEKSAKAWLAEDPKRDSRPFFSGPHKKETRLIFEKGNFGLTANPKQQPTPNYYLSSSGMVRSHEIDEDVIQTAHLFASLTKWKKEYFLKRVVLDS